MARSNRDSAICAAIASRAPSRAWSWLSARVASRTDGPGGRLTCAAASSSRSVQVVRRLPSMRSCNASSKSGWASVASSPRTRPMPAPSSAPTAPTRSIRTSSCSGSGPAIASSSASCRAGAGSASTRASTSGCSRSGAWTAAFSLQPSSERTQACCSQAARTVSRASRGLPPERSHSSRAARGCTGPESRCSAKARTPPSGSGPTRRCSRVPSVSSRSIGAGRVRPLRMVSSSRGGRRRRGVWASRCSAAADRSSSASTSSISSRPAGLSSTSRSVAQSTGSRWAAGPAPTSGRSAANGVLDKAVSAVTWTTGSPRARSRSPKACPRWDLPMPASPVSRAPVERATTVSRSASAPSRATSTSRPVPSRPSIGGMVTRSTAPRGRNCVGPA